VTTKILFSEQYDGESIVDVHRDFSELWDEMFNPVMSEIPSEDGFWRGTFKVTVEWSEEAE